jgi:hypothetical protein
MRLQIRWMEMALMDLGVGQDVRSCGNFSRMTLSSDSSTEARTSVTPEHGFDGNPRSNRVASREPVFRHGVGRVKNNTAVDLNFVHH